MSTRSHLPFAPIPPGTARTALAWRACALLLGVGLASQAAAADRDPIEALPASLRLDPDGAPLDAKQLAKLGAGAVSSRLLEAPPGQTREAVALVLVESSPAEVFAVLRDYPHFAEFMPHVASATIDDHTGNRYLVIPAWMKPRGVASGVVDAVKAVRDRSVST